ncbi:MAG: 4-(cytidine 5'-diphospho)-2-C-methyl-D-erythritol kinase [Gammaproteobacteria bacterium]|nr:4-(cytidine 5'-diphospho)-2-C-methyl-D-erythritol kinase [Gammaproteobacteria bacterium]MDH5652408.1 4-(cytidine 5'-diphospho)-2-C-methyl-D-erythritol kinase [Gammaproteobacteria bacterium]
MSQAIHSQTGWPAPAKLNLFLHITGRRADGYHLLQSVFQFLDYGDELRFTVREDSTIRRTSELSGVRPEQDLVVRAARLLQDRTGTQAGVDIHVSKKLPMGGGLGGGSSNAATTLVALNQLWGCGLDIDSLAGMGLQLGADVPVFVRGEAAWAEGVGENLTPVTLPEPWYVVLIPPVTISTAEVFSDPQLIRDCPPITIRDFLSGAGDNICEPLVRNRYPEVAAALNALAEYAPSRMTGTGACVFAAFEHEQTARAAWNSLQQHWQGFVAQGRNRSPLYKS